MDKKEADMSASTPLRMVVFASLMAALIAVGAFLAIPVGPVPIVLQNMFVLLAGLLLGSRWGAASVAIYLLAGACGLPVFAGGSGGVGHLIGPLGGYLLGFLAAAWVVGYVAERANGKIVAEVAAMAAGSLIIYGLGVFWLKTMLGLSLHKALAVGMYPFLIGDALKIAAAVPIARSIRPLLRQSPDDARVAKNIG
jgi:biotin transport system substrate-specific component